MRLGEQFAERFMQEPGDRARVQAAIRAQLADALDRGDEIRVPLLPREAAARLAHRGGGDGQRCGTDRRRAAAACGAVDAADPERSLAMKRVVIIAALALVAHSALAAGPDPQIPEPVHDWGCEGAVVPGEPAGADRGRGMPAADRAAVAAPRA